MIFFIIKKYLFVSFIFEHVTSLFSTLFTLLNCQIRGLIIILLAVLHSHQVTNIVDNSVYDKFIPKSNNCKRILKAIQITHFSAKHIL